LLGYLLNDVDSTTYLTERREVLAFGSASARDLAFTSSCLLPLLNSLL